MFFHLPILVNSDRDDVEPAKVPCSGAIVPIHVHAGGQAVVGTIERPGGGDRRQSEEQPRAKQNVPARTPAPEPPLWSPDAARDAVPVTRDGERPVPDARGHIPRCSDR